MSQRTENQVAEMKKQTIGVEVEMNSITREKAARLTATFFGTGRYENTACRNGYCTWSAWDESGREWKFQKDVSIAGPDSEKCEMVTPILTYVDMETLQELVRRLRKAGAKSDATRGCGVGVTAASATAITADELIDLFYSLNSAYRKNAVWLLNDSTMKNIRKLKDSNGQYLWQPALHEGGFDTLLGKRIYTSPYAPELAAGKKTVAFGDFNYYWIGDRLGITFKRLNERFAETGQIGFIASKRLDGKLILPEAIKVLQQKGSASSGG